jgi:ribosomal protein S12 methylthiotransferase accessory factor
MEIQVSLDGGMKVTGRFHGHTVVTDQPREDGGGGAGPAPFDLFLASLATCAGFFVQRFCQARGIPSEGISIVQTSDWDEASHLVSRVRVEVRLPAAFPDKYRAAVVAAANQCTVKRHLQHPPQLEVVAV